nr:hypothetical protein [Corynebacterium lizhenjunii]
MRVKPMVRAAAIAITATAALVGGSGAATAVDSAAAYRLPQRWNDDYQPGTYCSTPGARGMYVEAQRLWFKQTDATSVANRNDHAVPVKHTVKDTRTQTTQVWGKATPKGEVEKYLSSTYGFHYVHQVHWSIGQTVGPYTLESGEQGKLVWGFMMLDASGQDVTCSTDQEWVRTGRPYSISAPQSRYSELQLADAPVFG